MSIIQRLEQLTGPDRQLADEVLLACGWVHNDNYMGCWYPTISHAKHDAEPCYIDGTQPNPLASIDAALTLVPQGWEWLRESPETMCAYLPKHDDKKSWEIHITGAHKFPAIALCIAALRARGVK